MFMPAPDRRLSALPGPHDEADAYRASHRVRDVAGRIDLLAHRPDAAHEAHREVERDARARIGHALRRRVAQATGAWLLVLLGGLGTLALATQSAAPARVSLFAVGIVLLCVAAQMVGGGDDAPYRRLVEAPGHDGAIPDDEAAPRAPIARELGGVSRAIGVGLLILGAAGAAIPSTDALVRERALAIGASMAILGLSVWTLSAARERRAR